MAQQMRKFEQDAIVNQIIKTIKSKFETNNETLKTTKEYIAVDSLNNDIEAIDFKVNILRQEKEILQSSRAEQIKAFKDKFNVELDYDYKNNLMFNFNDWTVKRDVEDKLAISLLDSEWKDNLPAIMKEIASQF